MSGGLELVRDRVARLEALVSANSDKTCSLVDRVDTATEGFLSLRDSHEKHVIETTTHVTEMLEDMMTLSEALRETLVVRCLDHQYVSLRRH